MYVYAKASQRQRRKCEFILLDSFPQQAIKTGSDGPHILGEVWIREKRNEKRDLIPNLGQSRHLHGKESEEEKCQTVPALK